MSFGGSTTPAGALEGASTPAVEASIPMTVAGAMITRFAKLLAHEEVVM